jgi:ABC-2 type transport system ATP-binding protein
MIKINQITKIFNTDLFKQKKIALDNISFELPEHSVVGFLGPNGAGKTTLIKIMMDFIRADEGSVEYLPILGGNYKEKIGYLPERPYFYPHLTGRDFLYYLGSLSGLKKSDTEEQIKTWATRLTIDQAMNRALKYYSKGMLQRIGFLAAVLNRPKLLILDEPAAGLDPLGRIEIKKAIKEVHNQGTTVFFSTHIVSDMEEISDHLIYIQQGKLIYEGKMQTILDRYPVEKIEILTEGKAFEVSKEALQEKLKELVLAGKKIDSVTPLKSSLEDIVYRL